MNSLQYALYQYAMEHRADPFLHENQQEEQENLSMVMRSMQVLSAMDPTIADHAQRIYDGLSTVCSIHQEAAFLAGLSIGVELHRM